MQRLTSFFLVFALLTILGVVFTQAKVSFEFTNTDQYTSAFIAPMQVRIKTTDENINGMTFESKLTDAETGALPAVSRMTFLSKSPNDDDMNYPEIFGAESYLLRNICMNVATGQVFGIAEVDDGIITIVPNAPETFGEIYDKKGNYGSWEITCPVFVDKITLFPFTKNMVVTWLDEAVKKEETIEIVPPTKSNDPKLRFIKTEWKKTNKEYGVIDFTFETTFAGVYDLSLVNGPLIQVDKSHKDNKIEYYCTSNGNDKFGRIFYGDYDSAKIYLPTPPTAPITCQVQFYHDIIFKPTDIRDSTDQGIRLEFGEVFSATSYTKFESNTSNISRVASQLVTILDNSFLIKIGGTMGDMIANPITNSSVFTFDFTGSDFPVSKIDLKSDDNSCHVPGATISIDGAIITVKDFKIPDGPNDTPVATIVCDFTIKQKFNFEIIKETRFRFTLDGKPIKSVLTNKESIEIYYDQELRITKKDDNKGATVVKNADDVIITDLFELHSPKNYPVPIDNAYIIISVIDNIAPIAAEDYEKYITCTYGNDKTPMELKYDPKTLTWVYQFTNIDFKIQAEYNIPFQCTRQQKRLFQYGIDITTIPSLTIWGYVLDKNNNAIALTQTNTFVIYDDRIPETKPDGVKVPEAAYLIQTISNIAIPTNNDISISDIENVTNKFQTRVKDLLSSSTKDEYNVATVSSASFVQSSTYGSDTPSFSYFDITAYPKWMSFITNQLKVTFGNGLLIGNVISIESVSDTLFRYQLTLSQLFIASNPKTTDVYPSPNIEEDAYESDLKLSATSDYVPVTDTLGSYQSYEGVKANGFWATKVDGCGVVDGLYLQSSSLSKPNWSDWSNIRFSTRATQLCAIGQTCKISTDCQQSFSNYGVVLCESSKCTFKPTNKPRVSSSSTPQFASLFIVVTLIIVALLF